MKKSSRLELSLSHVIGTTSSSPATCCYASASSSLITIAGATVVIQPLPPSSAPPTYLTASPHPKALSAVASSSDAMLIAAGEQGRSPRVIVWDVTQKTVSAELLTHSFGLRSLAFSPDGRLLASMGQEHDDMLVLWEWRSKRIIASIRVKVTVNHIAFSPDSLAIVSSGTRHLKYWDLSSLNPADSNAQLTGTKASQMLQRGDSNMVQASFCSRTAGCSYSLSHDGFLCMFDHQRALTKWVDVKVTGASSISCCSSTIACGCNEGIVRLFETETLLYKATLPRPLADDSEYIEASNKKLPDVKSVVISSDGGRLFTLYADRSIVVFCISNIKNITRVYSSICHLRCVWDVACFPPNAYPDFPRGGFVTAAADNSVRMWHMPLESSSSSSSSSSSAPSLHPLSSDMSRMAFMRERSPTDAIRCLKISQDFSKLIIGDKAGRVKMFSLPALKLLCSIDAHEAEVLCVDVCADIVASSGRDRLVHLFQITGNALVLLNTIDDHSSSVTAVKFCAGGKVLATCATDKSVIFRNLDAVSSVGPRSHAVSSKRGTVSYGSIFDLVVDPKGMFALTCGQNRQVSIWDVATATQRRSYKMDVECTFKVALDSAVSRIACASSDHAIRIIDWYSGQVITEGFGHGEPATSICFSHDNGRLLSVSADGCIFIWSLQNPRQSKPSASLDVPLPSSQAPNPVPRLLLEVPDATEPIPPLVSARAKQAEEQRALLYRMLGSNQPQPQQQQPPPSQQQQQPHDQLLMESAKLPIWAKRPHEEVDVSYDREDGAASSSSPASLPAKPAPLHRVAGRWVIGDALRIPTIMGDTQHSASDAAAADADGFTSIPPALKPELLADPLPSASGGRSRVAWGQEGAAEVFDAGVRDSMLAGVSGAGAMVDSSIDITAAVTAASEHSQLRRSLSSEYFAGKLPSQNEVFNRSADGVLQQQQQRPDGQKQQEQQQQKLSLSLPSPSSTLQQHRDALRLQELKTPEKKKQIEQDLEAMRSKLEALGIFRPNSSGGRPVSASSAASHHSSSSPSTSFRGTSSSAFASADAEADAADASSPRTLSSCLPAPSPSPLPLAAFLSPTRAALPPAVSLYYDDGTPLTASVAGMYDKNPKLQTSALAALPVPLPPAASSPQHAARQQHPLESIRSSSMPEDAKELIAAMRQEADRITGAQHRDHEHHEHHHHQPASSLSSSSNAAVSPLISKSQEAPSTHPHFLTTSLPSPSSSIVPASPAPGPDAEELLSALQVSSPPRSSANRSGPLDTPPHSSPVATRLDSASIASVLMEKFDDVEESFHIDKDEANQAGETAHVDHKDDDREMQLLPSHHETPCVDPNDVVGNTSASLHQAGDHLSSSAGLIATQSPSPRIDVHNQYQQQQQQQQTASQLPLSQVLNSLDNAEAALALALQAFDAAVCSVRASGGGAQQLLPMRHRLQGMAHRVTGSLRSSMEFRGATSGDDETPLQAFDVENVLETYSERLLQIMQRKMNQNNQ